jgi:hypothetical protein
MQHFLNDCFTASSASFFQNADTQPSSFEVNALLILPDYI